MAPIRNLTVDQGSSFSVTIELSDALGNALDLTNYIYRAQLRKSYGSNTYTAFSVTVTNDPTDGQLTLALSSEQTGALRAGRYVYDIEIENDVEVTRVLEGIITVSPEVTR